MDLTLDIYKTRLCKKGDIEKTVKASDFYLSMAVCEDVLNAIHIDMLSGGLSALSNESQMEIAIDVVANGLPFFTELMEEIFEVSHDEIRNTKVEDLAKVVWEIAKYSLKQLGKIKTIKPKN